MYYTSSEEETIELGRKLASALRPPCTVLLIGNLGAGKTTLAKGIIEGLHAGAADDVSSPTFTLIHEFAGRVYHIDLYRLDTAREVSSLGLDEQFDREDAVVLIEWGERFPQLVPENRVGIYLEAEGDSRHIRLARF